MLPDKEHIATKFLASRDALDGCGEGFARAANDLRYWLAGRYIADTNNLDAYIAKHSDNIYYAPVHVQIVHDQPYPMSVGVMRQHVLNSNVLYISDEGNQPDLLGWWGNLQLRAVHDIHHILLWPEAPFTYEGESRATAHMLSLTANPVFQDLLYSEGAAQTAVYYHLGDYLPKQKVVMGWRAEIAQLMAHFGYHDHAANSSYIQWVQGPQSAEDWT